MRAYQRKLRRLTEGAADPGSPLWCTALEFIRSQPVVTRLQLTERFARDEERQLLAVVHDLIESGLGFRSGSGARAVYRAASESELAEVTRRFSSEHGLEEWIWVVVYRDGPLSAAELRQCESFRDQSPPPDVREISVTNTGSVALYIQPPSPDCLNQYPLYELERDGQTVNSNRSGQGRGWPRLHIAQTAKCSVPPLAKRAPPANPLPNQRRGAD